MEMVGLTKIAQNHSKNIEEAILCNYATKSSQSLRRFPDKKDVRPSFSRDTDRILHSKCYTRYIDKTQVFYLFDNDDITHRVLHVQFVSKIARAVGRALKLNEDLIEAIALGHDVGHPPFGHEGEGYLDNLCKKHKINHFVHSVQSVIFLDEIEKRPGTNKPLNLNLQVLDGILCHDGEIDDSYLIPQREKDWSIHIEERKKKIKNPETVLIPMTLEGCVVRYADVISYIGRDIEDAITVNLLKRSELPKKYTNLLGNNNRDIINTLVTDLIKNSSGQDKICYSDRIDKALKELRKFNYRKIYLNKIIKRESKKVEELYKLLFNVFLRDIKEKNAASEIYRQWIDIKDAEYISKCRHPEIVRDFLASFTDDYFIGLFERKYFPRRFGIHF